MRDSQGIWRKVVPLLGPYVSDRQELELVCMCKQHSCWHCSCPVSLRDNFEAITASSPFDLEHVRNAAMHAATTGEYGNNNEWQTKTPRASSILRIVDGRVCVLNMERYTHCAAVLHVYPEPNIMWDMADNIYQQCRDDPMHHMLLGMMPRVQEALLSTYIHHLHPEWAVAAGVAPGKSGILGICRRIGDRLMRADHTMKSYVAGSWYRALNARLNENGYALKWGLTATEHLQMFELLPFCLHNLASVEVTALNTRPHRPNGATLVIDPSRDIIYAVCSVLDWYELAMSPKHTVRSLQRTNDKALELMRLLKDIFKSRHVGIPFLFLRGAACRQEAWT